ncbi:MAG: OmpA family protein [Pseudomonadales bacterium]|nr:OmpA family protein [Pseudomonadales bacterium]
MTTIKTVLKSSNILMLGAVVAFPLLTGCVSTSKYEALEQENAKLTELNEFLEADSVFLIDELLLQDDEIIQFAKEQDELEVHFAELLSVGRLKMEMLSDGLHITLREEVLFESGQTQLSETGKEIIREVAEDLASYQYQIVVIGNTDNVPVGQNLIDRYPSNWEVAGERASSVVRLMEAEGVSGERLAAVSFGSTHAIASNDTEDGKALNRRIDIRLRPMVRR